MVEAGLSLTVLIMTILGLVDMGIAFYHLHSMQESARRALRWAVVNPYDETKIKNVAVFGNPDGTGGPITGLDPALVTVSMEALDDSTDSVSITIERAPNAVISPWVNAGIAGKRVRATRVVESAGGL